MCLEELIVKFFNKSKIESKQEAYKEVLKWLDENFYNKIDMIDYSFDITGLNNDFDSKEQMLQSFKERFSLS